MGGCGHAAMTEPRIDYDRGAAAFRAARTLPAPVLAAWRDAVGALGLGPAARVLDVGSGTGQFLRPLADWLGGAVVGIEPAAGMRDESRHALAPGRVTVVAGAAEALPVRPHQVDVAWLSTVVHQIARLDVAVAELQRVLRPGGHVLIRGYFSDLPMGGLFRCFPGIEHAAATFPTTAAVVETFEHGGFLLERVTPVTEVWEIDRRAWAERARSLRHVDSALRALTDAEFAAGITAVLPAADAQPGPVASEVTLNLVCLGVPAPQQAVGA